ncbi:hypothetical protein AHAS_Ahas04G0203100 [Arachis hypogaea]
MVKYNTYLRKQRGLQRLKLGLDQQMLPWMNDSSSVLKLCFWNCICSVQCKQIKEEEVDEQILSSFSHTRVYHGVKNHVTRIRLESLNFKESMRK